MSLLQAAVVLHGVRRERIPGVAKDRGWGNHVCYRQLAYSLRLPLMMRQIVKSMFVLVQESCTCVSNLYAWMCLNGIILDIIFMSTMVDVLSRRPLLGKQCGD